ncbi:MAG TPA: nucleoside hydrolase [Candidatus Acidoferrales bacterium]|nr:nucleoside hydrolase [Candidatus Acidoferrales bacterium]
MPAATPTPIIIDCDPGHDDMVAILLALASPSLEVRGLTTVGGNATLAHVTENALRTLALANRSDVPVAAGAAHPLVGPLHTAAHVHGESGLDGPQLPAARSEPVAADAVTFIADQLERADRPLTLVPTGPQTNIGLLLRERPDLVDRIAHICFMGGAAGEGNITPSAEFNVWVDPEAADLILRSGVPITMIGLDVTHRAILWDTEREAMAAGGGAASKVVAGLLGFYQGFHRRVYGWDGGPIHDAVAVAHLANPGLVTTVRTNVTVELRGEFTRGRTVVDLRGVTDRPANADVGLDIDRDRFVALLRGAIASYD